MDLGMTDRVRPLVEAVRRMVRDEIAPLDAEYHAEVGRHPSGDRFAMTDRQVEILKSLKEKAKAQDLWNFWLTDSDKGYGLSTVEYAYLAEEMGAVTIAPEVFNCNAPDTGNMEVLERYGTEAQKARWLPGVMAGETRSAYLMTEPGVASSDATQISLKCERQGEDYVLNGEKYWATGAGDPRCSLYILMACSDPGGREARAPHDASGPRRQRRDRGAAPDAGLRP
jgi:acyl-CoA dehydrogenase